MGSALVERALRRVPDVRRGVEIGLTDLEVDDVAAGRLEGPRAGRHLERRLRPDVAHAFGKSHGSLLGGALQCRFVAVLARAGFRGPLMAPSRRSGLRCRCAGSAGTAARSAGAG